MHKLASLSLANRALIALITVFVMAFGALTTTQLKQELIPSISIPSAFVMTSYPGASPQVVDERVTGPIEQAILALQGLESYSSTSATGLSTVTVNVKYGSNMAQVQQEVQAAISRVKGFLPEGTDSQVFTGSFDDLPVQVLAVSDGGTPEDLAGRLNDLALPALEKLEGVRSVQVSGARDRQVTVSLDPAKLTQAGLTVSQVNQSIMMAGGLVSGGQLAEGDKELAVTIGSRFTSADDVAALALVGQKLGPTGTPVPTAVTLGDIAKVVEEVAPATSISRTNGKPSLTVAITKVPDASTVTVSHAVTDALPDIGDKLGSNPTFDVVFDQAPFITQSIHDLLLEGGLGLLMAVIVILIFLLSVRSTLVTAISIPVSVLLTMIGLKFAGFSLNILTLGALTIAVGRVVDDSIVVIENIKRHLSYGEPKGRAIITAVREVATAVTAATITTVAVFIPIGLVGGQTGELFRPFAFTVTLALLASLLVSLTIIPVLAYWFLKPTAAGGDRDAIEAAAHEKERTGLLQRAYLPALHTALRHPWISLGLAVALLGATVWGATFLKTDFLGAAGMNTVSVTQKFPPALSLEARSERAIAAEKVLMAVPGVTTVQATVGSSGGIEAMFSGGGGNTAAFSLTTDPDADQTIVQDDIRKALDSVDTGDEFVVAGAQGMGATDVAVIISAPDTEKLKEASEVMLDALKDTPGATNVASSLAAEQPQLQVSVNEAKAAAVGLSDFAIGQMLRGMLTPATVGTVELTGGRSIDIVLVGGPAPVGVKELGALQLDSIAGKVPLSSVASVTQTTVPTSIARTDGQRSVLITLTPTGNDLGALNSAVTERIDATTLPAGASATLGGVSAEQSNAFRQLGLALLAAIAIVYVVMVATFKSLVQPLILTVSIPFAAAGALLALIITDTPLGVPAMIGLLMLVGIVVTNAIVLIDLVNHYRNQGDGVDEALEDGARQRLRPILMTAVATVFALIPMALGLSGGGVFISKPLAIVVIGGLVSSTALTLLLVPVLYHLVEGFKERRSLRRGGTGRPAVADDFSAELSRPRRGIAASE